MTWTGCRFTSRRRHVIQVINRERSISTSTPENKIRVITRAVFLGLAHRGLSYFEVAREMFHPA